MNITKAQKCQPHGVVACGCLSFTGAMKPVAMDSAASMTMNESFAEQKERASLEVKYGKGYRLDQLKALARLVPVLMGEGTRRTPAAAMDVAPGLTQNELLQLVIDLTPRPAKPAKRRAPVGRDSFSDSSTADLNKLYAKLHRTNKR